MPNIKTYDTPNLGLNPTETGVEAFAAAGRRGGAFFNQGASSIDEAGRRIGAAAHLVGQGVGAIGHAAGELGDVAAAYVDHQEISRGAKDEADKLVSLTKSWNDTIQAADKDDPSTAQKWTETVLEPALNKWKEGFTTERSQAWAEHRVEQIRNHFFEHTSADVVKSAGLAAQETVIGISTKYSNLVVQDPSKLDLALDNVNSALDDIIATSPGLKGVDAVKIKTTIAQDIRRKLVNDAAFSAIQKSADPEAAAAQWAKDRPDEINGKEALTLGKAATVQARTNALQARQAETYDRQNRDHAAGEQFSKVWSDNVTVDPVTKQLRINPKLYPDALNLPKQFGTEHSTRLAEALINWGEQQQKARNVTSNQDTLDDLDSRMYASDKPTTLVQVLDAESHHLLSPDDARIRRELVTALVKEPITNEQYKFAMQGAKELIEGTGIDKEEQAGKYAAFQQRFLAEYQKQYRAGTLSPNALSLNDPKSLIMQMMNEYESPMVKMIRNNGGIGGGTIPGVPSNAIRTTPAVPTPGVSSTPPVSLPPVNKRERGKSYMTGRGMMTWTGTGWLPLQQSEPKPGT